MALPGVLGQTTSDFYSGPVWRWDRVGSLHLDLVRGTLASATELSVLNGANALMIENQDDEWEVLQFATATPNGSRSFILSDLLRGQRGTEHAMRNPVPAGARVLVLNAAVGQASIPASLIGLPLNWRVGAADRNVSDPGASQSALTLKGRGRRPLSPVRLVGRRLAPSGDWHISWIRQTRIGGDSWEAAEVPLAEEAEAYRLEILAAPGGDVRRTFETTSPDQIYSAAQQVADFGVAQAALSVRVAQRSATFGPGIWLERTLSS
jgi:hypothetical protein